MLQTIEINPESSPKATVIWLHGLGASGYDFADIVPMLDLPEHSAIKFIFPHAPIKAVTCFGNEKVRAWFDMIALDRNVQIGIDDIQEDEIGIMDSEKLIGQLIEREIAQKIPSQKIVLVGFSQGGAMALHCGLRYHTKLAGILVLSAWLPLARTVVADRDRVNLHTPILMLHGNKDDIVPIGWAEDSYNCLKNIGHNVSLSSYPMTHTVCPEEIATIGVWLRALLLMV